MQCMKESPVNKMLLAYQLRQETGGWKFQHRKDSGIKSGGEERFTLNTDEDRCMKSRQDNQPWGSTQNRITKLIKLQTSGNKPKF